MDTQILARWGEQVRAAREDRGWTQIQLAHAASLSQSTIARIERGTRVPSVMAISRINEALDVTLVFGEDR